MSFPQCVLPNVSSNGLPEKRQSHTVCIYLTSLRCVLLNVSSDGLLERKRSCTGCICLTLLHCVISYETSKNLDHSSQTHTGCICSTFLQCVFSNVFNNMTVSRLDNVSHRSRSKGKKLSNVHIVHWLHLFDFPPLCNFI